MLFHNNAYQQLGNKSNKDHEYHSMHKTPNYDYQNVEIEFDKGVFQTVQRQMGQHGTENTIFSFRSPYRYNSELKVTQPKAMNEIRLNSYGASLSSDLDDKNGRQLSAVI